MTVCFLCGLRKRALWRRVDVPWAPLKTYDTKIKTNRIHSLVFVPFVFSATAA
jgi:hypothetical protein